MQNTMINNKEREALQEIFKGVNKFIEAHNETALEEMMNHTQTATQVEKVHTLLYMDLVKDSIRNLGALRGLLEETEEKFIETVTDGGKLTLDDVERKLMTSMMMDILFNK